VIDRLIKEVKGIATLEMETFHLFHLASIWYPITRSVNSETVLGALPSQDRPVRTDVAAGTTSSLPDYSSEIIHIPDSRIRAASVHMVYAQRDSQDVITPEEVDDLENWVGKAVLECVTEIDIEKDFLHREQGSVWEMV